jgi:hypothetical protein
LRVSAGRFTFTPKKRPAGGQEYELDAFQPLGRCIVQHVTYFDPKKISRTYTVNLHPGSGRGHPAGEWGIGEGTVNLEIVPRHSRSQLGNLIGRAVFKVLKR